jgi:hypothetical protein
MIPEKVRWSALVIICVALAFVYSYSAMGKLNFSETMAFAQFVFTMLAFGAIIYTLYFTSAQFRKSMAKPLIKVSFNEQGDQQVTLTCRDGALSGQPQLWLINQGNAISRYFQIDFIIPENIGKQLTSIPIARRDGKYVVSNTNDGKYTLFVNRPHFDPNIIFWAAIDTKKCIEVDSFEIEYRIYGDWAETQEGKLKVNINKQ